MDTEKAKESELKTDIDLAQWIHVGKLDTAEFKKWWLEQRSRREDFVMPQLKEMVPIEETYRKLLRLIEHSSKKTTITGTANAAVRPNVILPPGYRLASIASFLLTRKAFTRFVEPIIADMQHEYIEAIAAGHEWHARWITLRGYFLVIPNWIWAAVACRMGNLLRRGL